jgi:hypothetical protein
MMQSTGQASMHSVQPMHQASSMNITWRGPSVPQDGSRGSGSRPVMRASRATTSAPPGGQRLMSAWPDTMACA